MEDHQAFLRDINAKKEKDYTRAMVAGGVGALAIAAALPFKLAGKNRASKMLNDVGTVGWLLSAGLIEKAKVLERQKYNNPYYNLGKLVQDLNRDRPVGNPELEEFSDAIDNTLLLHRKGNLKVLETPNSYGEQLDLTTPDGKFLRLEVGGSSKGAYKKLEIWDKNRTYHQAWSIDFDFVAGITQSLVETINPASENEIKIIDIASDEQIEFATSCLRGITMPADNIVGYGY